MMNILMTNGIVYEFAPQSPDRGVKNTGRGEAKRNPCKKEPQAYKEGTTEILSPLSGLQFVHASYAGVSLRCTTCLCSVAPIRASICSYILRRGFATLHHLPVFCPPLSGLAITIRINMMPISIIILYELRIMNYELWIVNYELSIVNYSNKILFWFSSEIELGEWKNRLWWVKNLVFIVT